MNLRDLKYAVILGKERHFAKAAKLAFVSQPTLSMQIKKLEEELGVRIFERSKTQFLVTAVGKEILKKAENVLREAEEIKNIAKNSIDPYAGDLTIGAFPTLAPYFFPKVVGKISKKFPRLKLLLVEEKTEVLLKKLRDGEIDLALLARPIFANDLESIKIFEEEFLLAVPTNHELAKKRKINPQELDGRELMLLEDGHCMRNQALAVCEMNGAFESNTFKATSLETLKQMIAAGSGITLIPKIAVKKEDKISYIELTKAPKRTIGLFFRKNSSKNKLAKELAETLQAFEK